jgi:hypothetical protein
MNTSRKSAGIISISMAVIAACAFTALGDEGMWLFTDPPRKLIKEKYDFEPTDEWLAHLQHSSIRFNNGGSGSFVSSDGLILTNHHVGSDAIQKLSSKEKNYVKTGFYACKQEEEIKCVDLELNVLMGIEDVTEQINAAVKSGSSPAESQKARRAAMNTMEKESLDKTGLRSDVVTLYHGGLYHLYRLKKYTDVRLVFAPEQDIAFFGGDPDNFEYPRFDLDICFFRAYENDKPVEIEHFLKWSPAGAKDGELVFVSGHPGRTNRLNTVAHLEFLRDRMFPYALNTIRRREVLLNIFSERSDENARRAQDDLFGYCNSRKARLGMLAGLQDPAVMDQKRAAEETLRRAVMENTELRDTCGEAWDQIAAALRVWDGIFYQHRLLERGSAFNGTLFGKARTLLRLAEETSKPNAQRLREYRKSNLDSLRQKVFSKAPIYKDLETAELADSLGMYMELAGADDQLVQKVLAGKSPQGRASELVRGTRLQEVAVRKRLAEGGSAAVKSSDDPMIGLARLVDPPARRLREQFEQQVDEPLRQAYAKIAKARFALTGSDVYPDATFTLRLAFGTVKGYMQLGRQILPWTTLGGAYRHAEQHGHKAPFALPRSWMDRKDRLDLSTPCNFVCTTDIIGGNSGSPVVNRNGELVGVIFDGNRYSFVWSFIFTDEKGRAVSVHSSAIVEALRKVYEADTLADELGR